jgi:predicted SPOUT superfamily RNA methylase MTH1
MLLVEGLVTYVDEENSFFYLRIGKDTEIKVRCKDCLTVREGQRYTFRLVAKKYRGHLFFFLAEDNSEESEDAE